MITFSRVLVMEFRFEIGQQLRSSVDKYKRWFLEEDGHELV